MGFVPFMVSQAVCVWLELDMPLRRGRHREGVPLKKNRRLSRRELFVAEDKSVRCSRTNGAKGIFRGRHGK